MLYVFGRSKFDAYKLKHINDHHHHHQISMFKRNRLGIRLKLNIKQMDLPANITFRLFTEGVTR